MQTLLEAIHRQFWGFCCTEIVIINDYMYRSQVVAGHPCSLYKSVMKQVLSRFVIFENNDKQISGFFL